MPFLTVSVCRPGVFHFQNETICFYLLGLGGLQTAYLIALSYWKPLYYPVNCHWGHHLLPLPMKSSEYNGLYYIMSETCENRNIIFSLHYRVLTILLTLLVLTWLLLLVVCCFNLNYFIPHASTERVPFRGKKPIIQPAESPLLTDVRQVVAYGCIFLISANWYVGFWYQSSAVCDG